MRAIIKHPGHAPFEADIENTLETLQGIIGGYIETLTAWTRMVVLVNEEGKLTGLADNFRFGCDVIVGPAVFVGYDGDEDFTDCPMTLKDFRRTYPEMFTEGLGVMW